MGFIAGGGCSQIEIVSVSRSDFPALHFNQRQISLSLSSVNGNAEGWAVWGL